MGIRRYNRFSRGGCFKCRLCGKTTRDVNGSNGSLELCELCEVKTGAENSLSDNSRHPDAFGGVFDDCPTSAAVYEKLELLLKEYAYPKNPSP